MPTQKRSKPAFLETNVPKESWKLIDGFMESRKAEEEGFSANTLAANEGDLLIFSKWLALRKTPLAAVRACDIREYLKERLFNGTRPSSLKRHMASFRKFFEYLEKNELIEKDPTTGVTAPGKGRRRVPQFLTTKEIDALLRVPKRTSPIGFRNWLMFTMLYRLGLRVGELLAIRIDGSGLEQGTLHIGSGYTERELKLDKKLLDMLREYLFLFRPDILRERESPFLFPTRRSERITRQMFFSTVRKYREKAGIERKISPFDLRHACAKRMREDGMSLYDLERYLGYHEGSDAVKQLYGHIRPVRKIKPRPVLEKIVF